MNHLDLESKEGKALGGFNYPLYEIGVPFIYMNAVGSQRLGYYGPRRRARHPFLFESGFTPL